MSFAYLKLTNLCNLSTVHCCHSRPSAIFPLAAAEEGRFPSELSATFHPPTPSGLLNGGKRRKTVDFCVSEADLRLKVLKSVNSEWNSA